jgi:hypothetical protein
MTENDDFEQRLARAVKEHGARLGADAGPATPRPSLCLSAARSGLGGAGLGGAVLDSRTPTRAGVAVHQRFRTPPESQSPAAGNFNALRLLPRQRARDVDGLRASAMAAPQRVPAA